jgi:hypothetical protein
MLQHKNLRHQALHLCLLPRIRDLALPLNSLPRHSCKGLPRTSVCMSVWGIERTRHGGVCDAINKLSGSPTCSLQHTHSSKRFAAKLCATCHGIWQYLLPLLSPGSLHHVVRGHTCVSQANMVLSSTRQHQPCICVTAP